MKYNKQLHQINQLAEHWEQGWISGLLFASIFWIFIICICIYTSRFF